MTLALSAACSSCGTNHASSADGGSTQDATIDGSEGGPQDSSALDADSASIADGGNIADSASSSDAGGCLATGSVPTSAVRPRVFMGLTGSNFLADSDGTVDEQWTYVRQNLDGIWGNNANVTAEEEASLWCKIATRTLITEWDAVPDGPDAGWVPVGIFSGAQAAHPDLVINREAISFWPPSPSSWEGVTIASANAEYVTNTSVPAWELYGSVYTGWQPQEFATPLDGGAEQAFDQAGGTAFECPLDACLGGAIYQDAFNIITAIHAQGKPFVWFASNNTVPPRPDWPTVFKNTYNYFSMMGLWQPNDVVMIINYDLPDSGTGGFPPVPETLADGGDAPTVTGMLYWALHQAPIAADASDQ